MLRTASAMLEPHEDCIDWPHLPDDMIDELRSGAAARPASNGVTASLNLAVLSRVAMRQALDSCGGNMSQAARQLGISRQTLYRKLSE